MPYVPNTPCPPPRFLDTEERQRLVEQFRYLPRHVAKRLALTTPAVRRMGVPEAAAWGMLGLLAAADQWNPDAGVLFKTYAYVAVMRKILHYACQYGHGVVRLPANAERTTNPDLIQKVAAVRRQFLSVSGLGEDGHVPEDPWLAAPEPADVPDPDELTRLAEAMAQLSDADRRVLRLRLWEGQSLQAAADVLNLSRERVRQLQTRAVGRLGRLMAGEDPAAVYAVVRHPREKVCGRKGCRRACRVLYGGKVCRACWLRRRRRKGVAT